MKRNSRAVKQMGKDRILVVDDDPDNRAMIAHFLTNWGYAVEDAKNGKHALEKVFANPPQLVLMDLEMPEMDGFEACERLKTNPETEWIPVIIFTGLEKMPHRIRGFRHGADDYVVKTVEPDELRTRIELVLKRTKKYSSLAGLTGDATPAASEPPPPPAPEPQTASADRPATPAAEPSPASTPSPPITPPAQDLAVSVDLARIPFPEAMRLVLAHGKNGVVQLSDGVKSGTVHLSDGGIVHAQAEQENGEEAFYDLALWKSGRFDFKDSDPGAVQTIRTSTRSLLVEASRRLDAWNMISSKVPSFDLVPKWVPLTGAKSIRLTKSDWALIRLVDGQRSIRDIVDALRTDIFEAGRVVYSLLTVGVLRLDADPDPREEAFDLVPQRGSEIVASEPFVLTAAEWVLLSRVDGHRNLGAIRESMNVEPPEFMKAVRGLKEKGFLKLTGREETARKGA